MRSGWAVDLGFGTREWDLKDGARRSTPGGPDGQGRADGVSARPSLTPEDRTNLASAKIEAEGQLKTAQTHAEAARVALDRAQRMLASQTGSQRLVDEAQAQFDSTQQAVAAAASRLDLLEKLAGELEQGTTPPLSIDSPLDGLLRNVAALPGENVPGGGLLFEVVNLDRVWVRVPIYVGDVAEVDAAAGPGIGDLAMRPGSTLRRAEPIHAPQRPMRRPGPSTCTTNWKTARRVSVPDSGWAWR